MKDLKIAKCGCGGHAELYDSDPDYEHSYLAIYWVECEKCGISTIEYNSVKEAVNAWNTAMGIKNVCKNCKNWITDLSNHHDGSEYCVMWDGWTLAEDWCCGFERNHE